MTEYRCHWWQPAATQALTPSVTVDAQSPRHGAALALQRLVELGCDVNAIGAHVDITDADGVKHTVLVEEVFDWLKDDEQAGFVQRHGLATLLQQWQA
jgi:hypothetical protein